MASLLFSSDPGKPQQSPHKQKIHMLSPAKTLNQTSHPLSVLVAPLSSCTLLDHPTVVCCSSGPVEEATPTLNSASLSDSHANTHPAKVRWEYRKGPFPHISVHSPNNILNDGARFPTRYAPSLMKKKKKTAQRRKTKKREEECRWGGRWGWSSCEITTGWGEEKSGGKTLTVARPD